MIIIHKIKQRYIFKIESSRLRRSNWDLSLTIADAKKSGELISLADNSVLRFIREINGTEDEDSKYTEILNNINSIKKEKTSTPNRRKLHKEFEKRDELLLARDYITVVMRNKGEFDRANRGFFINGVKFKRLVGTTGGIKNSTIVYVSEKVYPELSRRLDNDRDLTKMLVPAKLEAYKALACSTSIPVDFDPVGANGTPRVAVIDDCITEFKADIIKLDIETIEPPNVIIDNNYDVRLEANDGFGFISPRLSEDWTKQLNKKEEDYISSGFCIRNSFCKGMLFTFDFHMFADEVAKKDTFVDAWGNTVNVNDVDIIMTTSMLKLHDSYSSMLDYLNKSIANGYEFTVTKVIEKELSNQKQLNYQFIQSLYLNDEDIEDLTKLTIDNFKDILQDDYRIGLLFLRGMNMSEDNLDLGRADIATAIMINKEMYHDPFVKSTIHKMLTRKIQDAKVGVLTVDGNYSLMSGDPYLLAENMFELENPKGLLGEGEYHSEYWNKLAVKKVSSFRAPMTCHNNIRVFNLKENSETKRWYKYMNNCTIINGWDTTTHAMNGADYDGDIVFTTDNPTILRGVKPTNAIVCVQQNVDKELVTEAMLVKSNKDGFGDDIGTVTNRITSMFTVKAQFEKDSAEYQELERRIMWGQHYQQMAIDKIKGVVGAPMPKEWFSYYANMSESDDTKEIKAEKKKNIRILADKKPYFMSYIYPRDRREHLQFKRDANRNSLVRFGMKIEDLINKKDRTKEENTFVKFYYIKMPMNEYPCLMNKICYKVEEETKDLLKQSRNKEDFDPSILKSDHVDYRSSAYKRVKNIHSEYKRETQGYMISSSHCKYDEHMTAEDKRLIFADEFRNKALKECSNEDELCNIVVDLCYNTNESKQFAWDVCGNVMIKNLLRKSDGKVSFPKKDSNGDIKFGGLKFSMSNIYIDKEEFIEQF